jgi:serine phosphatase RsbU (regulator of sigma subunit)
MLDYERLQSTFREYAAESPEQIIRRLMTAGDSWMDGAAQEDDITLLVVRVKDVNEHTP